MNLLKDLVTVFTPVYNGADTLDRIYTSLVNQSDYNFEWIVINDGSTDSTKDMLNQYISDAPKFNINLVHQENSGKHIAIMRGIQLAKGELFLVADADDTFKANTIEFFRSRWNELRNANVSVSLSGISVLCYRFKETNILGDPFPANVRFASALELNYMYNVKGEKWGIVRTDLLRNIYFPDLRLKSNFLPESYLWYQLSKKHKIALYNIPLRHYFKNEKGLMSTSKKSITWRQIYLQIRYSIWIIQNFGFRIFIWNKKMFFNELLSPFKSILYKTLIDLKIK